MECEDMYHQTRVASSAPTINESDSRISIYVVCLVCVLKAPPTQ